MARGAGKSEGGKAQGATRERASTEARIALDRNGIVRTCNRAAERMLGWTETQMVGRPLVECVVAQPSRSTYQRLLSSHFAGLAAADEPLQFQAPVVDRSGRCFPCDVTLSVSAQGNAVASLRPAGDVEDIRGELQSRTEQLASMSARLEEVLRSRDRFLGRLCHDLRSPLMGIIGTSESLRRGLYGELTDEQRQFIEWIEESGWQVSRNVNAVFEMLQFAASTDVALQESEHDAARLCNDALETVRDKAGAARVRVEFSAASRVGVLCDRRRIVLALSNLLANALNATPPDRAFGLTLRRSKDASVELVVWDEGRGLEGNIEQLFQAFVHTERPMARRGPGLGLGLPLARAIARRHGGDLRGSARAEGGSEFVLTIPWQRVIDAEPA